MVAQRLRGAFAPQVQAGDLRTELDGLRIGVTELQSLVINLLRQDGAAPPAGAVMAGTAAAARIVESALPPFTLDGRNIRFLRKGITQIDRV